GEDVRPVGWAVGVDLTRRDLQAEAKAKGRPWEAGKAFDQSAPCGALSLTPPAPDAAIELKVNGAVRQSSRLADMIWDGDGVRCKAAALWTLKPGDRLCTGTREAVGSVSPGDGVEAVIAGPPPLRVTVQS